MLTLYTDTSTDISASIAAEYEHKAIVYFGNWKVPHDRGCYGICKHDIFIKQ